MVNETIANATINATTTAAQNVDIGTATMLFFTVVIPEVLSRLFTFVAAPFLYPEMWWLLIHLVLTFVLFEFYFERHRDEELGWSAALANSIVMVFIGLELIRSMYHHKGTPWSVGLQAFSDFASQGLSDFMIIVILCGILVGLGLFTALVNYFHLLPKQIAWLISGHKTVNLLAYFLIVLVFRYDSGNPIPIDLVTIVGLVLYGALMWSLIFMWNGQIKKHRERKQHKHKRFHF